MDVSKFIKGANARSLAKLGSDINPRVATGPSDWAKNYLEKFGWKKGKGLGKKEDGIADHVKVRKKDDQEGIGFEELEKKNEKNYDINYFASAYNSRSKIKIGCVEGQSSEDEDDSPSAAAHGGSEPLR